MKISGTKRMSLTELITYIRENDIREKVFIPNGKDVGNGIVVDIIGNIEIAQYVDADTEFLVEVEEDIKEDTKFAHLIGVFHTETDDLTIVPFRKSSIKDVMTSSLSEHEDIDYAVAVHVVMPDGQTIMIWSHEKGIAV